MPIEFYGATQAAHEVWNNTETIGGQKTFSDTLIGDISSNGTSYFTDISARNIYFTGDVCGNDASFQILNVGKLDISNNNISTNTNSKINIRTTHDNAIRFYTNDEERMRIKGNGNVGIGTSNPDFPLDIQQVNYKGIRVVCGHTNTEFLRFAHDNTSVNGGALRYFGSGSNIHNAFRITMDNQTGPAIDALNILQNGRVGINHVIPSSKLYVNGDVKADSYGSTSDDRIKYNETELTSALDTINKLKPRKYEKIIEQPQDASSIWIPTDAEWDNVKDNWVWDTEIGFIAQDVRNDVSELSFCVEGEELDASGNQTMLNLNYNNIFTLSIAALQEVDRQLQAEKAKTATLEAENTDLRADIELIKEHLGISTEVG